MQNWPVSDYETRAAANSGKAHAQTRDFELDASRRRCRFRKAITPALFPYSNIRGKLAVFFHRFDLKAPEKSGADLYIPRSSPSFLGRLRKKLFALKGRLQTCRRATE